MERTVERRRPPPLTALRAFEAAARHLNFSRAADELSVTPGAVSQQIQNLEDYVGAALFKRTPRGLLLNDAAQAALQGGPARGLRPPCRGSLSAHRRGGRPAPDPHRPALLRRQVAGAPARPLR